MADTGLERIKKPQIRAGVKPDIVNTLLNIGLDDIRDLHRLILRRGFVALVVKGRYDSAEGLVLGA